MILIVNNAVTSFRYLKMCQNSDFDTSNRDSVSPGEVIEVSEGEVGKCQCDSSIGEIKLCKYVSNIKSRVQFLKKNPKKLMEFELGNPNVSVIGRKMHYNNWYSYYVSNKQ